MEDEIDEPAAAAPSRAAPPPDVDYDEFDDFIDDDLGGEGEAERRRRRRKAGMAGINADELQVSAQAAAPGVQRSVLEQRGCTSRPRRKKPMHCCFDRMGVQA